MRLSLSRTISAPPSVVWACVTEPERMNRWSRAAVRMLAPGDGGHPGGVGALRRVAVDVAGQSVVLREVITGGEPGRSLSYRVMDGGGVRRHRGRIELLPRGQDTELCWEVEAALWPGLDRLTTRLLASQIEASLDVLADIVQEEEPPSLPPVRDLGGPPAAELWREAEDVLAAQRRLRAQGDASGAPSRWFSRAYELVTENLIAMARAGAFLHPAWVLRLIPRFHDYYVGNLEPWEAGAVADVEAHWRRAFWVMENGSRRVPGDTGRIFSGLILGIRAHIEDDLTRALAEVYADHYAGRCDYVRFRGDYVAVGDLFGRAGQTLADEMPQHLVPRWARLLKQVIPEEIAETLRYRRLYNLPRRRMQAFERGAAIARLLTERTGGGRC